MIDLYTEHGGTKGETQQLMATLKQRGIPFFATKDTEQTPADLRQNRLFFHYSEIWQAPIMNTDIIWFNPDGTAHCLWTEVLPLHELGRLQVTRATNIEFNGAAQQWEVKDRKGEVRFFSKSRSVCLEWEHEIQGSNLLTTRGKRSLRSGPLPSTNENTTTGR